MISEVPSKAPTLLFSTLSLCSGECLFLANIQVLAFKHKYSQFSLFTVAVFYKAANAELKNTELLLQELGSWEPLATTFHQLINT